MTAILRFDSVAHFVETFRAEKHQSWETFGYDGGYSWDLNVTGAEALDRALNGDPSIARTAIDLVSKIHTDLEGSSRTAWISHVSGSRVDVPAFVAGSPLSMRRRVKREQSRHVSVYVDMTCSAGIKATDMVKRGATILGFLESLQRNGVDVDLYLVTALGGRQDIHHVIRVESRPLDLSTAAFAIAHPSFSRNLCYGHAHHYGFSGAWSSRRGTDHMRSVLGLEPHDVYVPSVYYGDKAISQPVEWISERLSQTAA